MGDGIASDIINGFPRLIDLLQKMISSILSDGKGAQDLILTLSDNSPHAVCSNVDRILPALTVTNNGTATVNIGVGGVAIQPLLVNQSYTFRWKNPKRAQIVVNDLGNSNANVTAIS